MVIYIEDGPNEVEDTNNYFEETKDGYDDADKDATKSKFLFVVPRFFDESHKEGSDHFQEPPTSFEKPILGTLHCLLVECCPLFNVYLVKCEEGNELKEQLEQHQNEFEDETNEG